jgi:hypothetical protein
MVGWAGCRNLAVVGEGNRFAAAGAVHLNGLVVETLRGFFQEFLESGGAEMVYDALPDVFGRLRHRLRLSKGLAGPVLVAEIRARIRRPEGFLFLGFLFLNNDPHNDYNGWTPGARRVKREKRVNLRNVA